MESNECDFCNGDCECGLRQKNPHYIMKTENYDSSFIFLSKEAEERFSKMNEGEVDMVCEILSQNIYETEYRLQKEFNEKEILPTNPS
jgi:hypothetical protein